MVTALSVMTVPVTTGVVWSCNEDDMNWELKPIASLH